MSRSKQTDPRLRRALRRLRAPHDRRGKADLSLRRRVGIAVERVGAESTRPQKHGQQGPRLRVTTRPARVGFHHPANKHDVLAVLEALGPIVRYGLRAVEFVRQPHGSDSVTRLFGRYQVPGRILLFEQPISHGDCWAYWNEKTRLVTNTRAH